MTRFFVRTLWPQKTESCHGCLTGIIGLCYNEFMKITMQPAISLDGYIALPGGDSSSWVNPADEERYNQEVERCGCVLVGRTTYQEYKDGFDS